MKKIKNYAVIGLLFVAMMLVLAACNEGPAALATTDYDDYGLVNVGEAQNGYEGAPDDYSGYDVSQLGDWFEMEETQLFGQITGQVVSIEGEGDDKRIHIEGEEGSTVFSTYFNTYFMGAAPEIGTTITGVYEIQPFALAIYPPQFEAMVIINNDDVQDDGIPFIHVDFFFGHYRDSYGDFTQLRSADGQLVINVGFEGTEVILQSGEPFDGDFTNRTLLVTYAMATFSLPPQTTPIKIVVLYERAVTGPEFIEMPEDWVYEEMEPWYCIVIDGEGLVGPQALFMDWEADFQSHVELIPVAEFLGAEVEWNQDTNVVTLEGRKGSISFEVGSNDFTVNGETVTLNHAAEDFYGMLVVPVRFFSDVFGMGSAYSAEGRIFIHTEETDMR